jgi:MtfA peptidase
VFSWSKKRLQTKPILQEERQWLARSLWQSSRLSEQQQERLIRWVRIFIRVKNWEGCNGLKVTDEMKWCVACAAGLMVLEYPDWYFDKSATILMYPTPYKAVVETRFAGSGDAVIGGEYRRAGETTYRGPVILNWRDLEQARASENEGQHLVIHEFAHQLDMMNGAWVDGLPPLPQGIDEQQWLNAFQGEFQAARRMVADGYRILMNDYGLSHESEFFAVASELYFQLPAALGEYHPNVYALLKQFYRTDSIAIFSN